MFVYARLMRDARRFYDAMSGRSACWRCANTFATMPCGICGMHFAYGERVHVIAHVATVHIRCAARYYRMPEFDSCGRVVPPPPPPPKTAAAARCEASAVAVKVSSVRIRDARHRNVIAIYHEY